MKYLMVSWLLLFILQCNREATHNLEASSDYVEILIHPADTKETDLRLLVKNHFYLKLEIPDSLYFSRILKNLFDEDNIYLLDRSRFQDQILSFDLEGNFKYHINKPGRGPGEFTHIYDFDIRENELLILTNTGLKIFNKNTGAYIRNIQNAETNRFMNLKMLNENLLITESGRYRGNTSKNQVKVYDLEVEEFTKEFVPFENHALKGFHSNRYLYYFGDSLSVVPMYDQTIYRVFRDSSGINIKAAYEIDFGEYWVPNDFLAASYKEREIFFDEVGNYISTFEVFETDNKMYIHYKHSDENYAFIYDKKDKLSENIKLTSSNELGWFGAPIATYKNSIVNTITIQKVADYLPKGNKEDFQQFFSPPNEQNTLVLLFVELE